MKRTHLSILIATLGFALIRCGSDSNTNNGGDSGSSGTGAGGTSGTSGSSGSSGSSGKSGSAGTSGSSGSGTAGEGGAGAGAGGEAGGGAAGIAGAGVAGAGEAGAAGMGGATGAAGAAGGSMAGAAGEAGAGSTIPASFQAVVTLLDDNCGSCHSGGGMRVVLGSVDPATLYTNLTTALPNTVPTCRGETLVTPGDTGASFILTKLTSDTPTCANNAAGATSLRMPRIAGTNPAPACTDADGNCLTLEQVAVISDWITAGAPH